MTTTSASASDVSEPRDEAPPARRRGIRTVAAGLGGAFVQGIVYRVGAWLAEQLLG